MILIGSKTEQTYRDTLLKYKRELFDGQYKNLLLILQKRIPDLKTAYFINHIPEQGEDSFTILVNDNIIAYVERKVESNFEEVVIELSSICEYEKGCGKQQKIKLAVAMNLAVRDLERI